LLEKELIVITGRNEQLPGKPLVYNTSRHFMDYFGINSAEDLPRINEVLASQIVEPTLVNAEHFDVEEGEVLAVSEDGELVAKVGDLPADNAVDALGDEGGATSGGLLSDGAEEADNDDDAADTGETEARNLEGGATSGGLTATGSDEADNEPTAQQDAWADDEEADNDDDASADTDHADDTPIR
jgi:segregation and condensation protein B